MKSLINAGRVAEKELDRQMGAKFSLTFPQYQLLDVLSTGGNTMTMGDMADQLVCSRGNLTGIVDRLERDGWILRERSKDDRRTVLVWIAKPDEFQIVQRWVKEHQPTPPAAVTAWLEEFLGQRTLATA